ncbi:Transcription factor [Aspergillus sclerotialis]|uniref:Transcription factor n=1 Tax=Aspergillus sclerotialis TaxID=2070753 RepID=A0A3A2Z5P8_9EURO|nr:Transcription factor [Aspergillus sclerotialis]
MGSQSSMRPLAPARPGLHLSWQDSSSSSAPRRKNSSTACIECRRRRSKCAGGVPCETCRRLNIDCVIDEESDNRRKVTLKRKIESLEEDRDLLIKLLESLREGESRRGSELLALIQSNAPLQDIRQFLTDEHCPDTLHNIHLDPGQQGSLDASQNTRRKFMDVERLSDVPLYNVPAKPWTTITDDDGTVSHLVSHHFTWNQPIFNWIDRDLFIRDMKSKSLDSKFCSPLLVNAVLAGACFYSNYSEVYATPGDPSSRGLHFLNEAKRLLDAEEGRLTLPTFQGIAEIYVM